MMTSRHRENKQTNKKIQPFDDQCFARLGLVIANRDQYVAIMAEQSSMESLNQNGGNQLEEAR